MNIKACIKSGIGFHPRHATTHVPLAQLRLRNDVKRSGSLPARYPRETRLSVKGRAGDFAGPFDRFATVPPVMTTYGTLPGSEFMTPKITRFLAEESPATPCLVVDLEAVGAKYDALQDAFPQGQIYYAIKANPAVPILDLLEARGARFDVASMGEIALCLSHGIPASRLSYGNTVKAARAVAEAHRLGVSLFAFDSQEELEKIALHAPGARVFCRLAVQNSGAEWPLSRKFGTTPEEAERLLLQAASLGLKPAGLSFHVGSQQTDPTAYRPAIEQAARVYHALRAQGVTLDFINLGGGFPGRYGRAVPPIARYGETVKAALAELFPEDAPGILLEPGRHLVAEAGVVSSEVLLASRRGGAEEDPRWVYLDIGRFGGLAETEGEAIRYPIRTSRDDISRTASPCVLAGPTCDSVDVMYEKNPVLLPDELQGGDKVMLLGAGAYVTTYCSTNFNGFAPLDEHYI